MQYDQKRNSIVMKDYSEEALQKRIDEMVNSGRFIQESKIKKWFNEYQGRTMYNVKMKSTYEGKETKS